MATDLSFARDLIDNLDGWVDKLATPLMPPRTVVEGPDLIRLELREHIPHTVMIGKCVRAVSGIHAALDLADLGYVVECAALLRMVSDYCMEITAIGEALHRGGVLPRAVQIFVDQYFVPKPRTPEEFAEAERTRYASREDLMKAGIRLAESANVDGEKLRTVHRFLNMTYDAYVHGAYETTMELCDVDTGRFMMRGHFSQSTRQEFAEAVFLKLHEVVIAIEFTAAVTANAEIFKAARDVRHTMDNSEPWKFS
jgi:hypothetical protein